MSHKSFLSLQYIVFCSKHRKTTKTLGANGRAMHQVLDISIPKWRFAAGHIACVTEIFGEYVHLTLVTVNWHSKAESLKDAKNY